jgi:hypothetical protein
MSPETRLGPGPQSGSHPRRARFVARLAPARLVVSVLIVFVIALAPGVVSSGSVLALIRVPLESVVALAILVVLPWPVLRRVVAAVVALIFLTTILSAALDRGFTVNVGEPFNIVTSWPELADAYGVLRDSTGTAGAIAILILLILVAVLTGLLVAASFLYLARVMRSHYRAGLIGGSAITASWIVLALVGVQLLPGEPIAAADAVGTAESRTQQVSATEAEQATFDRASSTDPYAELPSSDLLTGLKGKDVVVVFVESYGQVAVQNTFFSKGVDTVLRKGNKELAADGYSERSAFLESSTFGGIS